MIVDVLLWDVSTANYSTCRSVKREMFSSEQCLLAPVQ